MTINILAVDDHKVVLRLIANIVKSRKDWFLITAGNREEILEGLAMSPDLVLLDINIGELSGFEVLRWIRESPNGLRDVPVVMLTAMGQAENTQKAFELGCNAYLTKPFKVHDLLGVIEDLIGKKKSKERSPA